MKGECPVCRKNMGKNIYSHLFSVHEYTKDEIRRLQQMNRQKSVVKEVDASCSAEPSTSWGEESRMQCPQCDYYVRDHRELVTHVQSAHAFEEDEYIVENVTFPDKTAFEEWKRKLEDDSITRWATQSKKTYETHTTTYMRCSRALPTPGYSDTSRCNTKKVVRYCTAYMKVTDHRDGVKVEFCRRHCGHEQEPALLNMDPASEAYIVSLLKDGFKYEQVLKKIRDGCRTMETTHTRLYYTTTRDIRAIAIRNKVDPARRHDVDTESVEIRIRENNVEDGIRFYSPAVDESGEGFVLVIITPIQRQWLEKYGKRAVCMDDTFNLTPYSLRLATVVVADEWDKGLPAAYLLSHRMTENEVALLFNEIRELIPSFDTSFFMSDDTNSFYNGFRKAFPHSLAKKLLCTFHITQSVERNTKKMDQSNFAPAVVGKVSELCKTSNPQTFASKYAALLTFLRELGEQSMVDYFERNWSGRVSQWGAFARHYSCMNTSMLIERFHRRLKHEFSDAKANIRIDTLLETMARGLREGRHRLQEHHRAHTLAVKLFNRCREAVVIVNEGRWTVTDRSGIHYVDQSICICDVKLNNHCQNGCSACAYAFRRECLHDSKSGVSCVHVHAALLYAPEGKIPDTRQFVQRTTPLTAATSSNSDNSFVMVDAPASSSSGELYVVEQARNVVEQTRTGDTDILDHNKDVVQQIEAGMAALRVEVVGMSNVPSADVSEGLDKVLATITALRKDVAILRSTHCPDTSKRRRLARRPELPTVGRIPNPAPIRLSKRTALQPKRMRPQHQPLPEYAADDIQFCVQCFRRAPATDETEDEWLKCTSCGMWAHERCTDGEGSPCPYDDGTFQCSLV